MCDSRVNEERFVSLVFERRECEIAPIQQGAHYSHKARVDKSRVGIFKEALKKGASDGQARRNQMKKRSLRDANEHFESDFNTA